LILGHGAAMQMDDNPVLIKWRGCNSIRRQEYIKTFFFFFSHTLIQVGYLDPTSELDLAHFYTHDWISTDFPQIIEHLEKKHIYTTVNKKKNNDKLMKLQNNSNWHTMYKIDIYKGEKQL